MAPGARRTPGLLRSRPTGRRPRRRSSSAGDRLTKTPSLNPLELLDPAAPIGLSDIEVAFRIHGERVAMRKAAELMAGTAERGQDLSRRTIQRVHLLVAAVHYVHVFLFLVW